MTPPIEERVFVVRGREEQFDQLQERLKRVLAGQPQVVFVTGDAGIGKTALVREFSRRAQEANDKIVVAWGQCSAQLGLGDPYLPFKEILALLTGDVQGVLAGRALTAENASRLKRLIGHAGEALVELGPDLVGALIPGAGVLARASAFLAKKVGWLKVLERLVEKARLPEDFKAEQLFEQFTRVLTRLTKHAPVILVLDDLHWADAGTLELLFYLTRRMQEAGELQLMIIGTYRLADVRLGREGRRHPLERVINEVRRYWRAIEIDLTRTVGGPTGRAFVDAFLDTESNCLDEDFRALVFRRTQGHPLFTVELLRALQERGVLTKDTLGRWFAAHPVTLEELPDKIQAVVEERIGRLESDLEEVLICACVEGQLFTAEVIAEVQQRNKLWLVKRLDEDLERRHRLIIAEEGETLNGQRLHRYKFRHALFQQFLYQRLSPMQVEHLHAAVGIALEKLYMERTSDVAGELARHFDLARQASKATVYYLQAADRAREVSANEDALRLYSRGLALLEAADDARLRFRFLAGRERVCELVGQRELQRTDLDKMLVLAQRAEEDAWLAEAYGREALYYTNLGECRNAMRATRLGQKAARRCADVAAEASSLIVRAWAAFRLGEYQLARKALRSALNMARRAKDPRLEANSLNVLGNICHDLGEYSAAQRYHKQALEIMQSISNRRGEAASLTNLGNIHTQMGDYADAKECYEQALTIRREIGDRWGEAADLSNLGVAYHGLADYVRSQIAYEQALAIRRAIGDRQGEGISLINLGLSYHALGKYASACDYHERAITIRRSTDDRRGEAIGLSSLGYALCALGEYREAEEYQEQALGTFRAIGAQSEEACAWSYLGLALEGLGRFDQAAEAYKAALQLRRDLGQHVLAVDNVVSLARLALTQGDLSVASAHVEEALAWIHQHGIIGIDEPMRVFCTCIRALQASREHERAQAVLREAHTVLMERAGRIEDPELRRSFLTNVRENKEIVELSQQNQAPSRGECTPHLRDC